MKIASDAGQDERALGIRASLAQALCALDQADAAAALLEAGDASDAEPEDLAVAARLGQAQAAVDDRRGASAAARQRLSALATTLADAGFELELARTLLQLGPILARSDDAEEARRALEQARSIFEQHGAKPGLARSILAKAKLKADRRW